VEELLEHKLLQVEQEILHQLVRHKEIMVELEQVVHIDQVEVVEEQVQ
jgi:hypothetical protein